MKKVDGVWFPNHELHMPEWMANPKNRVVVDGKGTYQYRKFEEAMKWVLGWGIAVDVGAHVGLWSVHLAKRFGLTFAFEPVSDHRDCFLKNVPAKGVVLSPQALGRERCWVNMEVPIGSSGGTHVSGHGMIPMITLDSLELPGLDFLKIDCEGYELEVLLGGEQTIRRCKPCCIVEQKQHKMKENFGTKGTPAVDLLLKWGAKLRHVVSGDYIVSFEAPAGFAG